jgi:hypothetical protein
MFAVRGGSAVCRQLAKKKLMPENARSYRRPGAVNRSFGNALAFLVWIGLIRSHFYVLEVRGRKSGKTISLPVDRSILKGSFTSSAPAANPAGCAMPARQVKSLSPARCAAAAMPCELPPSTRPPVLKAYLDRFASEVQRFFPVPKGRQWKHSTISHRGTQSSNCGHWTKPYSTKAAWAGSALRRAQRVFGRCFLQ